MLAKAELIIISTGFRTGAREGGEVVEQNRELCNQKRVENEVICC